MVSWLRHQTNVERTNQSIYDGEAKLVEIAARFDGMKGHSPNPYPTRALDSDRSEISRWTLVELGFCPELESRT